MAKKTGLIGNGVVLLVLDGWGIARPGKHNAISLARKPNFDAISREFGSMPICASGGCVGLEDGQMGNSEVGHLTIGAGRIILQDQTRIDNEIKTGGMSRNRVLVEAIEASIAAGSTIHFWGLLSDAGVHSQIRHLFALMNIARDVGAKNIALDAVLDGRDTPPESCLGYLEEALEYMKGLGIGSITTISGRYYAMDRDNRWDRTRLAYDALVYGDGEGFTDPMDAVRESYRQNIKDEFVVPRHAEGYNGLHDGDTVILFNFRPDRSRQIADALSANVGGFTGKFDRQEERMPNSIRIISMTVYDKRLRNVKPLIPQERIRDTLSSVLEKNGLRQFHVAETEKYAHVTYFFNGLLEKPEKLEERKLIPSPNVDFYDKTPKMSALGITEAVTDAIKASEYGLILANFANADMVGHTGKLEATIKAVECVDECLGKIIGAWKERSSELDLIITADHGNAEKKFDENANQPSTSHTSNPVPLIVVSERWSLDMRSVKNPGLSDIAPTVLKMLGIKKPAAMTGEFLVEAK